MQSYPASDSFARPLRCAAFGQSSATWPAVGPRTRDRAVLAVRHQTSAAVSLFRGSRGWRWAATLRRRRCVAASPRSARGQRCWARAGPVRGQTAESATRAFLTLSTTAARPADEAARPADEAAHRQWTRTTPLRARWRCDRPATRSARLRARPPPMRPAHVRCSGCNSPDASRPVRG